MSFNYVLLLPNSMYSYLPNSLYLYLPITIGYTISEKCKPDNEKLAEVLSKKEIKLPNDRTINAIKSISKLKNKPDRFLNAFENLLNSNFGRLNEEDRDDILIHIKRILA